MPKKKTLIIGGESWNIDWLKSVTLDKAVQTLVSSYERNTITNAWKQANGLTEPTTERKDVDKRERKPKVTED